MRNGDLKMGNGKEWRGQRDGRELAKYCVDDVVCFFESGWEVVCEWDGEVTELSC